MFTHTAGKKMFLLIIIGCVVSVFLTERKLSHCDIHRANHVIIFVLYISFSLKETYCTF